MRARCAAWGLGRWAVALVVLAAASAGFAMEIVRDGAPVAGLWVAGEPAGPDAQKRGRPLTERDAAEEIAKYVEKMSGAKLEIHAIAKGQRPPAGQPAIVVGALALGLGLPRPPQTVTGDGYRILVKDGNLLLAGEEPTSTFHAACHLLELLGCRWFFDNELGEVVPQTRTVRVEQIDLSEKPDFLARHMWGPNWHGRESWCRHNRLGGLSANTGHDWAYVPPAKYAKEHPEYYSLRGGERRPGNWVCTSNADVQRIFAESISAEVAGKGAASVSISPPDGNGYCECEKCRALDDPANIEPSSGRVAMSDRYQLFFNAVGEGVLKANPQALLNFYAYADYSPPPKRAPRAPQNLCAWVAPLRFCRLHSLSNPACESRQRCRQVVEGWAKVVSKIGWREYNYDVAELCVPFSKVTTFREDIPFLKQQGCLGLNIECLALWHIYGPHTYLVARLAWDADADVDAIMDDFYTRFCGAAAPHVKAYWERIDRAIRDTKAHAGSFYAVHTFWTPDLLKACEEDLNAAAKAADSDLVRRRIAMFRMGLENARFFLALRDATNRCDFKTAKEVYTNWLAHMDSVVAAKIHPVGEYRYGYAPRFLGAAIEQGFLRTTGSCKLLAALPDEWLFRYDEKGEGEAAGWFKADASADGWRAVKTYSATLNEQGIPERLTLLWYRTTFAAPAALPDGPIALWFAEVDGKGVTVFLNGQKVGEFPGNRAPGEVDITGKLLPGRANTVAVRIDHSRITELMLGGIIKPVMVYSGTPPAPAKPAPAKP